MLSRSSNSSLNAWRISPESFGVVRCIGFEYSELCEIQASSFMILGIESSCDESAIALYHPLHGVVGEWVHSQIQQHSQYGGVVPDLAVRKHLENFFPMLDLFRSGS